MIVPRYLKFTNKIVNIFKVEQYFLMRIKRQIWQSNDQIFII